MEGKDTMKKTVFLFFVLLIILYGCSQKTMLEDTAEAEEPSSLFVNNTTNNTETYTDLTTDDDVFYAIEETLGFLE